jgi:flagellar biosynthetic protein FliR
MSEPFLTYFALPVGATFLLLFVRTAAFLSSAPWVSDRMVPRKFRAAAAVLFAMAMTSAKGGTDPSSLPLLIPMELFLGVSCGFAARLVVAGIEAGGELIGMHLGLGFASTVDPTTGHDALPSQNIMRAIAGLIFLSSDGLSRTIYALSVPAPGVASIQAMGHALVMQSGDVLVAGVRFAAPVMLATLVANVAFALASRASPALNIFSVAFAGVLLLGGLALLASVAGIGTEIGQAVERIDEIVGQVAEAT